jgi:hypothetical protein
MTITTLLLGVGLRGSSYGPELILELIAGPEAEGRQKEPDLVAAP